MTLLHCVKRFLASDDGATDFENVVLVGCTVMLCLSIQITAHRHTQTAAPAPGRSAFAIKVAIVVADVGVPVLVTRFVRARHRV